MAAPVPLHTSESMVTAETADAIAVILYRVKPRSASEKEDSRALAECLAYCEARRYHVEQQICDEGRPWLLDREGIGQLIDWLARKRPDVVVVKDWSQISNREDDRAAFARKIAELRVDLEVIHPAGAPGVLTSDSQPRRQLRPKRWAAVA